MESENDNDLLTALNTLDLGVVIVDKELKIEYFNESFKKSRASLISDLKLGDCFQRILDINRYNDTYDVADENWGEFVSNRLEEIKQGNVKPREMERNDGLNIIYTVTNLSENRRLISYFNITNQKQREDDLAKLRKEADEHQARLSEAIESIDDGFAVFDSEDRLVSCNEAYINSIKEYAHLFVEGVTFEDLAKQLLEAGAFPIPKEKHELFLKKLLKRRDSEQGYEKIYREHDGTWIRQKNKRTDSGGIVSLRTNVTKLKNTEEELLANQALMHTILEASENAFLVTDSGENIKLFNDQFADILNCNKICLESCKTLGDIFAMLYSEKAISPFDREEIPEENFLKIAYRMYRAALRGESQTLLMVDGRYLRYRARELKTGQILHSYVDLTEETNNFNKAQQREKEAKEAATLLKDTSEVMEQGIMVLGEKNIEFVNTKAREMLDVPDDILAVGKPWIKEYEYQKSRGDFGNDQEADSHFTELMQDIADRVSRQRISDYINGSKLLISRTPNSFGGLTITFTDITEIRQRQDELKIAKDKLEAALVENEIQTERFKAFAEANSDWFWELDHDLRFCYFSETFEAISGVKPEFLLGRTKQETGMPGIDPVEFDAHLDDLYAHRPFRDFIHPRIQRDGSVRWLSSSANPVFNKNGAFEGYVGSGRDVTEQVEKQDELKKAKRAAEAAERAKSEFLANMSHEIRTPMNGVMGMAELLATTELDSKQKMFTDVIVKSGASLLTIINDILDFSKIDAGQMELDPAPFNLSEAIEDVATLISAKVAEKGLEMIVRVNPKLPEIMIGDVGRIRQIITNIVGNAVKFTENGHIYVNVDGTLNTNGSANLIFIVEDTGIGIPQEKCDQIFQKFSQVDTSATRKHEGTGLGLSIVSSLVNLMGGQIQVESDIGEGSRFWFEITLPVESKTTGKQKVVPGDLNGASILIIDDNLVNRSILSEQMTAWNFDSASASSGAEGLAIMQAMKAHNLQLDLVILDYQMSDMTGEEILRQMRQKDSGLKDVPAIMLTSVDDDEINKKLAELGVEESLAKPVRSSMLLDTILEVIANSRGNTTSDTQPEIARRENSGSSNDHTIAPVRDTNSTMRPDVLVAEDNEVNQIVFSQILNQTGLNYKIVENGRLALEAYEASQPRLILMDVSMPEMNGKEAATAIRDFEEEQKLTRVPIIGATAHALMGDMESCLEAGMDDYLSKPISPEKLITKMEQWLKIKLGTAASI